MFRYFYRLTLQNAFMLHKVLMKTTRPVQNYRSFGTQLSHHSGALGLVAVFVLAGCTTDKPEGAVTRGGKVLSDEQRFRLGTVGVLCSSTPASCAFDKPTGHIDYPGDRAGVIA